MNEIAAKYVNDLVQWLDRANFLSIIIVVVVAYLLCKITPPIVRWATYRSLATRRHEDNFSKLERKKRAKTVADLFSFVVEVLIIMTAAYAVLSQIGINLAPVIASAGIAGVALGFGAQQVVKDVLAGIFIVIENQYRVDDVIQVSGVGFPSSPVEGTVTSITLRKTTLRDRDGNVHIIPNGHISEVINRTLGYSKFRFTFAVDVDTKVEDIIKIVNSLGEQMARESDWAKAIVDPPHYDEFGQISKSSLNVMVSGTTMPGFQWKVSAEFRKRLVSELQKSDIVVADIGD